MPGRSTLTMKTNHCIRWPLPLFFSPSDFLPVSSHSRDLVKVRSRKQSFSELASKLSEALIDCVAFCAKTTKCCFRKSGESGWGKPPDWEREGGTQA